MVNREYKHPENKDKRFVDWRSPETKKELFIKWLIWRIKHNDIDHYMINNCYIESDIARKLNPNELERKLWFSIIFGFTYQPSMSWTIFSHFPDFNNIDLKELEDWNNKNYTRQFYNKDTRYNKGKILEQVASIKEIVKKEDCKDLTSFFTKFLLDNEEKSFFNIFNKVVTFRKFGRMTSWLCCQALREVAGVQIDAPTLFSDDTSNGSVRAGIAELFNKDENQLSGSEFLALEKEAMDLCRENLPKEQNEMFTYFLLETHLCQFKKLLRGGDYPGHNSGDHLTRTLKFREHWPELDYSPFFEKAFSKQNKEITGLRESRLLRYLCNETGQVINLHDDNPEFPNMYLELGIDKGILKNPDENKDIIKKSIENYKNFLSY
jgi:hypothetical protein